VTSPTNRRREESEEKGQKGRKEEGRSREKRYTVSSNTVGGFNLHQAQTPQQSNADKDLDNQPKKDEDADGFKLLGCPDPLEQASKLLRTLTTSSIDVWITSYDVSIRRSQFLSIHNHCAPPTHNPKKNCSKPSRH